MEIQPMPDGEDILKRRKPTTAVPRASMRPGFCINGDGRRAEPPDYLCPDCKQKLNTRFDRIFSELDRERSN